MATTHGIVYDLKFDRDFGVIKLRGEGPSGFSTEHAFFLYADQDVGMIDPTEMVRRNWMLGLLQHAFTHGFFVSIDHADEADQMVQRVTLHSAEFVGDHSFGLTETTTSTKGRVMSLYISPRKAEVTIQNKILVKINVPSADQYGGEDYILTEKPINHHFSIYKFSSFDFAQGRVVRVAEITRYDRTINMLERALVNDLEVSIVHEETDDFVVGVRLFARE